MRRHWQSTEMASSLDLDINPEADMSRNKKRLLTIIGIIILFIVAFEIDHTYFMPGRVSASIWQFDEGNRVAGDVLYPSMYTLEGDTIAFHDGRCAMITYQYFNLLVIKDCATGKTGYYEKFGSHWDM
jgi:hypothetical protein